MSCGTLEPHAEGIDDGLGQPGGRRTDGSGEGQRVVGTQQVGADRRQESQGVDGREVQAGAVRVRSGEPERGPDSLGLGVLQACLGSRIREIERLQTLAQRYVQCQAAQAAARASGADLFSCSALLDEKRNQIAEFVVGKRDLAGRFQFEHKLSGIHLRNAMAVTTPRRSERSPSRRRPGERPLRRSRNARDAS